MKTPEKLPPPFSSLTFPLPKVAMPKTAKVIEKITLGIIALSFFFFLHFLLSPSATTTKTAIHDSDSNIVGLATPAPIPTVEVRRATLVATPAVEIRRATLVATPTPNSAVPAIKNER
jgi:hypothetical protein